jgi:hypothetical protein
MIYDTSWCYLKFEKKDKNIVLLLFLIMLSVLQLTDSDFPIGIFKLFLIKYLKHNCNMY